MSASNWADLAPRVGSAAVMLLVAGLALWAGGVWFAALVVLAVGLMVWELARMIAPGASGAAIQAGGIAAGSLALMPMLPGILVLPILVAALIVIGTAVKREPRLMLGFSAAIWLSGLALIDLRFDAGAGVVLWMLTVVIVTDVAGYFAGRTFGGPKFWPRVSPKKTWSGTVAGWIAAGLVGIVSVVVWDVPALAVPAAVMLSVASQMGDIAESALKRRMGIKDSSALIPGHGGVMDRMDGMLGAAPVLWLVLALAA